MKTPTIQIRRKTAFVMKGTRVRSILTLESREGSRGRWNLTGEGDSPFEFNSAAERDAKIAELVKLGCVLK